MKIKDIYNELETTANNLGIKIHKDIGRFKTGFALVNDKKTVLINKTTSLETRAVSLARALVTIGLDDVYLKPAVRQYIEDETNGEEIKIDFEITAPILNGYHKNGKNGTK